MERALTASGAEGRSTDAATAKCFISRVSDLFFVLACRAEYSQTIDDRSAKLRAMVASRMNPCLPAAVVASNCVPREGGLCRPQSTPQREFQRPGDGGDFLRGLSS